MPRPARLAFVAVVLLGAPACVSRLTGNEGNLSFSYPTDDRPLDFNKPVAVGARLDMKVADAGSLQPVTLSAASFDDPGVLHVVDFADDSVTLESLADGNALLTVEAITSGGQDVTDSVNMLARTPEVHKIWHTCSPTADSAHYLVSQAIWVPYDFEMNNGQPVIGYGYYPVTLSDTSLLTLDATKSNATYLHLDSTATPGTVTLTSSIDGTTRTFVVVEPSSIDGIEDPIPFVNTDLHVGDTHPYYVLPSVGGKPVCQALADFTVASDTTDLCTVAKADVPPDATADADRYEYGWFEVTGVAAGTCSYTVTYPDAASGAGVSQQFSATISP